MDTTIVTTTTLASRYHVIEPLARGGFGQTFLAKDTQLPGDPLCVVKQLQPKFNDSETLKVARRLFNLEAETLHKLGGHDRIPRLMAHFEQDGEFYLVQEFIEGRSLDKEIIPGKRWGEADVKAFLRDILEVLAFVHEQNVIHRDIKPANLIRRERDNKIVLIDFGAVKERTCQASPHTPGDSTWTVAIGSPSYMPIEQRKGKPELASDIYAVGMMCLQALTGLIPDDLPQDPHTKEYSCALCSDRAQITISSNLSAILDRMVRYDYRQRYENATAALQTLEQIDNANETTIVTPVAITDRSKGNVAKSLNLEHPDGQIPLDSNFYIDRPPIEADCYDAIIKRGALIRIKAPRRMGKTSLLSRVLDHAERNGSQSVHLYLQTADYRVCADIDTFLKWFCAKVADALDLDADIDDAWKSTTLGSKDKCDKFFRKQILTKIESALVLVLDNVDLVFQYPDVAADFFGLLRAWHEESKNHPVWQKLRLAIAHSKEVYVPLNINQSPFNVGLPIDLPELNELQINDLVERHGLHWSAETQQQLTAFVGGHPYLLRKALYEIARGRRSLEEFLQTAAHEGGMFDDHLRRHLLNLKEDTELANSFAQLVGSDQPMKIDSNLAFRLRSMGLVKFVGNEATPLCDLYRQYFRDRLGK